MARQNNERLNRQLNLGLIDNPQRGVFRSVRILQGTRNATYDTLCVNNTFKVPRVPNVNALLPKVGKLAFDTTTQLLYSANGNQWVSLGNVNTLPAPLDSIANLNTVGNTMLYTTATDTYAMSPITPAGRSFLSASSAPDQRSAIGTSIGVDVQAHDTLLDGVVTIGGGTADQLLYTTGSSFSNTPVSAFARSSLLNAVGVAALNTTLGSVTGSVSTTNRLVRVSGTNMLSETGVILDGSDNISQVNDLSINGNFTVGGTLAGISAAEISQLQNIDIVTISNAQWGYLGGLDQLLDSSATPTFQGLNANTSTITNVANPSSAQDAATKAYVDMIASSGAPPLEAAILATDAALPAATYASTAQTLTADANGALSVDGVAVSATERILIKDQGDARQNGVYVVTQTGDGSNPFILTRTSDFNQTAMPLSAGTPVFVQVTVGAATNPGSSWALAASTTTVDPLTDTVTWVQLSGGATFTAGSGIDATAFGSGTLATDLSARLKYTGNTLDLNTVAVDHGGTGRTSLMLNGVLVGQGTAAVSSSKVAPVGEFVGTTDTQTLTQKTLTASTNNLTARGLFTNSGANTVSTYTAGNPTAGQVLVATSTSSAAWQSLATGGGGAASFDNVLYVFASASNVSPNFATIYDAVAEIESMSPAPSADNAYLIQVFPGVYTESTPITVPPYVTLEGRSRNGVIVRPTAPAAASPIIQLQGHCRLLNLTLDGYDTASNYATIGVLSYIGTLSSADACENVTVRNCADAAFRVTGNGTAADSKTLYCTHTSVEVTRPTPFVMETGYHVHQAAALRGSDQRVSGAALGVGGALNQGYDVTDDFSIAIVTHITIRECVIGVRVGGGVVSDTLADYSTFDMTGAQASLISGVGLYVREKSLVRMSDVRVQDDTGQYPSQVHMHVISPALPSNPNVIVGLWSNIRNDRITYGGAGTLLNPTVLRGVNLSELPGELQNQFAGEVIVGRAGQGHELVAGEGDSYTDGMIVWQDDGGVFTNVSIPAANSATLQSKLDLATTMSVNLTVAPATIDGIAPVTGISRILVKHGSTANPGATSLDNGVYVWNGTGVAMTRSGDFATGTRHSHNTWFHIASGTQYYKSQWKIDATTFAGSVVTINTTPFGFEEYTLSPFPEVPAANDALYIGNAGFVIPYYGIKATLTAPLLTEAGTTVNTVLEWEYWNGSAWANLPIMATLANAPYRPYANHTFGVGYDFGANISVDFQYRFCNILDWSTTTVNGVFGYWVRVRILNPANVTQWPVVEQLKLHSNRSEINRDGFLEHYGLARPVQKINIPINSLMTTGLGGDEPTAQRMVFANAPGGDISINIPLCSFPNNATHTVALIWNPPTSMDTSADVNLVASFSRATGGAANVRLRVNYAFIADEASVAIPTGTSSSVGYTEDVTIATSLATRGKFTAHMPLNVQTLQTAHSTVAITLSRLGSDGLDTYNSSIYLHTLTYEFTAWCAGSYCDDL